MEGDGVVRFLKRKLRFDDDEEQDSTLPDRFDVLALLGKGAMGEVYRVFDKSLGREVAVKVLHQKAWTPEVSERYRREARELERVRHPNVVGFHGHGTHQGREFLVLEYVSGGDLRQYLGQPREPSDLLLLFIGLCRGLAELHARGLIHRDLKPENVLVGSDGQLRITDLGLVRAQEQGSRLTSEGALVGTFSYLAPEQILSGDVSTASDRYALGAIFYEAFAGRPAFEGRTEFELLEQHVRTQPSSPREHNPDLPERLDRLILALLSKKPEERPALEEVTRVLTDCLDKKPPEPPPPPQPPAEVSSDTAQFQMMLASKLELEGRRPEALSAYRRAYRLAEEGSNQQRELKIILEELERPAPRKRGLVGPLLLLLLLLGAAGGGGWWWWQHRPGHLVVHANLPGAEVKVDGQVVGRLDPTGNLTLPSLKPGHHPVEVALAGHKVQGPGEATLEPGQELALDYILEPVLVAVELSVSPPEARVEIDGKEVTERSLKLPLGTHHLVATMPYHQTQERELTLEEGKPQKLALRLEPAPLPLQVKAGPVPVRVTLLDAQGKKLDEKVSEQADGVRFEALPGHYTLKVSRQGYDPQTRKLTLKPELAPVQLTLHKTPPPPPPPPTYVPPPPAPYYPPPPPYYPPPPQPWSGGGRDWNSK